MEKYGVSIIGAGHYIPEKIITNQEVETWTGLPAGEIEEKTGIKKRHIAADDETSSGMSATAAERALQAAGLQPEDVDLIVCCSFTGDYVYPAQACKVQELIGARKAGAFDVMGNCTGFQIGLTVASDRMRCDASIKHALVIGTALQSRFINWKDPNSAIYFGDGSGAVVLGQVPEGYGVLASEIMSNGKVFEAVRMRGGGSSYPINRANVNDGLQFYEINGLEVWKQLVQYQPKAIKNSLKKINKEVQDCDFFIFHQANLRLIEYLMGKLRIPMEKTHTNVAQIGNTADASMAIALSQAIAAHKLKRDHLLVISGVGAGFIFGSSVLRWY